MTAVVDPPVGRTPPAAGPDRAAEAVARPRREFGPVRWVPRAVVLLALAWWALVYVPGTFAYSAFAADACIYAIIGLSLNIVIGYTGQLSLGHQGFVGVGAFAAAYSLTVQEVPFAATFVIAAGLAAVFALVLGLVALRITGLYLALITLVFGLTLEGSLFEIPRFTNGGAGQPADRPQFLFDDGRFYLFCLAFLVLACYVDYRLLRSKTGRALLALKENERVAEAFGINVTAFKLIAFTLSGALAGVAGALFAYRIGIVTGSGFGFFLALTFVLMTVVGGLGDRLGVIMGSSFFAVLPFLLEDSPLKRAEEAIAGVLSFGDAGTEANIIQFFPQALGALLLLLTLVQFPGGLAQQVRPFTDWLKGEPFDARALLPHRGSSGPGTVEGSSVRA
ncbi:MAG: amino acid/amide transporter rane protein 2, family [Frankiales bacterium]|jgi:branched-chain amino acid transport system permease protein|nr:amino acid/amide transporter rane protein 2, family [Frankiales bacterium]